MGILEMWRLVRLMRPLRDQRGIETLEWLAIGALVITVAILVYGPGGTLATNLSTLMDAIGGTLAGLCCGGGGGTGTGA